MNKSITYTVKEGDTLFSIAKRYHTTVEEIEALNPGIVATNLQIGSKIRIPIGDHDGKIKLALIYVIKEGDTLYSIAKRHHTTVEDIEALNPGIVATNLQIGSKIRIPICKHEHMHEYKHMHEHEHMKEEGCKTKKTILYVIKEGDTLYSIAKRHHTTVEDIEALNPGIVATNLQIGSKIRIPICKHEHMKEKGCKTKESILYVIKEGDTLYSIAKRYHTTVKDIEALNPGIVATNLQIGSKIRIPICKHEHMHEQVHEHKKEEGCKTKDYVIREGDTLYSIAKRYHTTVKDIEALNPGIVATNLQIGSKIRIPVCKHMTKKEHMHHKQHTKKEYHKLQKKCLLKLPFVLKMNMICNIENLEDKNELLKYMFEHVFNIQETMKEKHHEEIANRFGKLLFEFFEKIIEYGIHVKEKKTDCEDKFKNLHRHAFDISRYLNEINSKLDSTIIRDSMHRQLALIDRCIEHRIKKEFQKELQVFNVLLNEHDELVNYICERCM